MAVDDFRTRHQAYDARRMDPLSRADESPPEDADRRMPAANVVSMVFLDRTPAQIADPADLLRSIHAEMDLIRRRQLGLIFIFVALDPAGTAGRTGKVGQQGRCEATCVLSNLGRAMADSPLPRRNEKIVAGNVVLDGIDFFAPVRDGTAVSRGADLLRGRTPALHAVRQPPHHRGPGRRPDGDLSANDSHVARQGQSSSPRQGSLTTEEGNRYRGILAQTLTWIVAGLIVGQAALLIAYARFLYRFRRPPLADDECPPGGRHPLRARTRPFLAGMPERLVPAGLPRLRRVDRGR